MEQVEGYSEKIVSLMKEYEQLVLHNVLFDNNRLKWKQVCIQKQRKIKNSLLQMKEQMDELPSSTAATFNKAYKDHQTKLTAVSQEFQKMLKSPVKMQTMRKQIPRIDDEEDLNTNRTIDSYFNRGDKQMARMKDAVQNMHTQLEEGMQLAEQVNLQLNRQIQQLDNIHDKVKDTGTTLKRADRTINFFVKAAQCDKCLLFLIISIILSLIALIVMIIKKNK